MSKYFRFEKIELKDTVILEKTKKDEPSDLVYEQLKKNKISNLKELFDADDRKRIQYGNNDYNYELMYSTKGTVKLLRFKYLGEDIPYSDILDGEIIEDKGLTIVKRVNEEAPLNLSIASYLCVLGLSSKFARELEKHIKIGETIISFLYRMYNDMPELKCGAAEYVRNIEKMRLILDWYKIKDDYRANVYTEEEAQSRLIYLETKRAVLQRQKESIEQQIAAVSSKINMVKYAQEDIMKRERRVD